MLFCDDWDSPGHYDPEPDEISLYSTLTGAIGSNPTFPKCYGPPFIVTYALPPLPRQKHYLEEFVPSPIYSTSQGNFMRGATISFDPEGMTFQDNSNACCGVPMQSCIDVPTSGVLRDPHELVFPEGTKEFQFVLTWPGYDLDTDFFWKRPVTAIGQKGPITRRELAYLIAKHYEEFVWRCDNWCQTVPFRPGPDMERWRVGFGGYTLDRMRLSALWNSGHDVWQASVRVLTEC